MINITLHQYMTEAKKRGATVKEVFQEVVEHQNWWKDPERQKEYHPIEIEENQKKWRKLLEYLTACAISKKDPFEIE